MSFENPKARPGGRGVDVSHGELPSGAALDAIRLKEAEVEVDSLAAGGLGFDDLEPDPKQLDEMDQLAFNLKTERPSSNVSVAGSAPVEPMAPIGPLPGMGQGGVDLNPAPKDLSAFENRKHPWGYYEDEIGPAPDWFKRVNPKHNW